MSVTSWFLVSSSGMRHRLPREMIFVGREDCELMLQSRSVDKQHAVINYNNTTDQHLLKDLGSLNGTFVNDLRIPEQTYIGLKLNDIVRFGYDSHVYVLEKSQHRVPEEALKHEKYTSQLQIQRSPEPPPTDPAHITADHTHIRSDHAHITADSAHIHTDPAHTKTDSGPTPLYGQPSWWGDQDSRSPAPSDLQKDLDQTKPWYLDPPTRDMPTRDTPTRDSPSQIQDQAETQTETPAVVQSHASFTIEFDDLTPGKIKIRDQVTKFSRSSRRPEQEAVASQEGVVMSSQRKVADWLVHSDISSMRCRPKSDDVYSIKSDHAVKGRILRDHHHDDGTQSDSEDPVQPERAADAPDTPPCSDRAPATHLAPPPQQPPPPQQAAFIIEFYDDDNPRKKRSLSFTSNSQASGPQSEVQAALRARLERRRPDRPASVHGTAESRSSSLRRDRGESETPPRQDSPVPIRPFGSVGRKSRLAQDFSELFRDQSQVQNQNQVQPTRDTPLTPPLTPPKSAPPIMGTVEDDSVSDAGTYTIDNEDPEVDQARSMIDQVLGPEEGPRWVSRWASLADESGSGAEPRPGLDQSETKARRILPQRPAENPDSGGPQQSQDRGLTQRKPDQNQDQTQDQNLDHRCLLVQDDVEPDSLSDVSRSEEPPGPKTIQSLDQRPDHRPDQRPDSRADHRSGQRPEKPSSCFYIGSDPGPKPESRPESRPDRTKAPPTTVLPKAPPTTVLPKAPPTTVLIRQLNREPRKSGIKPNSSAPDLRTHSRPESRPESRPRPEPRPETRPESRPESGFFRQESFTRDRPDEVQMKKLPHILSQPSLRDLDPDLISADFLWQPLALDSDSDLDSASTTSAVSAHNVATETTAKTRSKTRSGTQSLGANAVKKRSQTQAHKDRAAGSRPGSRPGSGPDLRAVSARDRLSEKHRGPSETDPTDTRAESGAKDDKRQALVRSNSLSAPRQTRASMLRRARLESDSEDPEPAKTRPESKTKAPAESRPETKPGPEAKKLSRLDILALPRNRTGSFGTSDSETSARVSANRNAELNRKSSVGDKGGGAKQNQPKTRSRTRSSTRSSGSKSSSAVSGPRRPKASSSSSEEDPAPRSVSTTTPQRHAPSAASIETEDDPYQTWTNHSAEIAKLSQDLVKDLAILAQEIHDVAGDTEQDFTSHDAPGASAEEEGGGGAESQLDVNMNQSEQRIFSPELSCLCDLSRCVRESTETLASNIRLLFQSKAAVWDELEAKLSSKPEDSSPQSHNQELSKILQELTRVQTQLQVMNVIVEPVQPKVQTKDKKPVQKSRSTDPRKS